MTKTKCPWNEVSAGLEQTAVVLPCLEAFGSIELKRPLLSLVKDAQFLIILRQEAIRNDFDFLENLFHEILHTIEVINETQIFRGSSMEQEAIDQREIVFLSLWSL